MNEDNFEEFILKKIEKEPHLAEQNRALLGMYKKGLIQVSYNEEIQDYDIQISTMGKDWYYCSIAESFTPAEA